MSTTSTVPTVKAQLVSLLTTALATSGVDGGQVPVFYGPPGPDGTDECVFLGRSPLPSEGSQGSLTSIVFDVGAIGGARTRRIEQYGIELTCWTWRGDLTPEGYEDCETRVFELFAKVEDVLAVNEKLALDAITSARISSYDVLTRPHPSGSGLMSQIVASVDVQAVLT